MFPITFPHRPVPLQPQWPPKIEFNWRPWWLVYWPWKASDKLFPELANKVTRVAPSEPEQAHTYSGKLSKETPLPLPMVPSRRRLLYV